MGLIFGYLTWFKAVQMQRLNRRMYYIKVPEFSSLPKYLKGLLGENLLRKKTRRKLKLWSEH